MLQCKKHTVSIIKKIIYLSIYVLSPKMINSVTVGLFMPPEILRVGFLWIFQNQWGFQWWCFLWWVFLCKSTMINRWRTSALLLFD